MKLLKKSGDEKLKLKNYKGAILDFTKAVELNPSDADAYKNRGIVKIKLGEKDAGCLDLSKAGELGDGNAYNAIKSLCK